jgi:hypothetical protein
MTSLEIAKKYFELSNESNFDAMQNLFTDTTTYSSQATGIYLGAEQIIAMQKNFHGKYGSLNWKVNSIEEVKPGIVLFDYDFTAVDGRNNKTSSSGFEYVIVKDGKIQHIEIRNK